VFDHVAIAVADLAASERFYRTVLSVLGAEPSHADAELVEWDDWDIGPTDREHPVTRSLHVGFRAPSREAVDAFWQAWIDAGYRDDGAPRPAHGLRPGLLRRLPARPGRQQRGGGVYGARGPRARRLH
jgi:catechol 2,3-dioxygenase-like lactoylglutathione lyase family enzyme